MPGSTLCLSSRAIVTLLETLDNLERDFGVTVVNITPANLCMRKGFVEGYIREPVISPVSPALALTSGYPYYRTQGFEEVSIGDAYTASIMSLLELLNPVVFKEVVTKESRKQKLPHLKIAKKILSHKNWQESCAVISIGAFLLDVIKSANYSLEEPGFRAKIRDTLGVLACTKAHGDNQHML